MIRLRVIRFSTDDEGTFGDAFLENASQEWRFASLELPWRQNKPGLSCIPAGTYAASFQPSPRFGRDLYELADVPGRDEILIHPGNWAGDRLLGYRTDVAGCILLGADHQILLGQRAVVRSREALDRFHSMTGGEPIEVIVEWTAMVSPEEPTAPRVEAQATA